MYATCTHLLASWAHNAHSFDASCLSPCCTHHAHMPKFYFAAYIVHTCQTRFWHASREPKCVQHLCKIFVREEAVLFQRRAKCGLHNSVKFGLCSPHLDLSLFCDILRGELDRNRPFFVNCTRKSRTLYAASWWKQQSTCLCLSCNEKRSVIEFLS